MKILLTGASGFIGKALLPELNELGYHVTTLSRTAVGLPGEIIAKTEDWPEAVAGRFFDICVHLAWIAKPGVYGASPDNGLFAEMTPRLAETLFEAGLPHFLSLGTCIEYAPGQMGPCVPNETEIAPETVYGKAKNGARTAVAEAARRHGKGYTWARLFYPYGTGEHPDRIPSTFLRTLRQGSPLELKTPDSIKDWIEIRDVVSALICVIENCKPLSEINLATGKGTDINTLALLAAEITGASPDLVTCSPASASDPYKLHIGKTSTLDALGWKSRIGLQEGLTHLNQNLSLCDYEN